MRSFAMGLAFSLLAFLTLAGCGVETTTRLPAPAPGTGTTSPAARPGERSTPDVPGNLQPKDAGPRELVSPPSPHVPG